MSDVSSRALEAFVREFRRRNLEPADLVRGSGVAIAQLSDRKTRIPWSNFCQILDNASLVFTTDELVSLGGAALRSAVLRPFGLVAGLILEPHEVYEWVYSPTSPVSSIFGCVVPHFNRISAGELEITLEMREGYAPNAVFNQVSMGVAVDLPRVAGAEPARVEMQTLRNGARYHVHVSARASFFGALRRILMWPLNTFRAGRALKSAHEDLNERYFQLERAQRLVAAQATQLETAYSISQAVHANLDLSSTLESVARSFTEIAKFTGAYVKISGPPVREAWSGDFDVPPSIIRPLEVRGDTFGELLLWFDDGADKDERMALAETVVPAVIAALDGARSYALVEDARQNLEVRVQQRTTELTAARDALSESVAQLSASEKARSRLFANVNHEIRTPLTLILLSVEEMRRAGVPPEHDRALAAVARNARKLLRLVDGLLLLAAGEEKRLAIAPREVDLSSIVSDIVDTFVPSARASDLSLTLESVPGIRAEVDELAIDRILSNLVSNALKFTPAGGEIVVSLHDLGDEVQLSVRDTGVGLSDAFMSRVFGRFEQDNRPVRPGAAGSGIGLSLVRELAEAHHGSANVERLTKGTLFRVVLPKQAAPDIRRSNGDNVQLRRSAPSDFGLPSGHQPVLAPASVRRDSTVLVIEDDEELRASIVGILSTRFFVLQAASGEAGLELAQENRPDMLVTDVGLPGMDGIEVTRRFRELPGNRMAPVLVLTAFATLEARLSGFDAGAVDYVTKPFEPHELLARVHAQLDRRRLALRLHESEKLAAIGTMTAGLAHEMRNPANGLVNAIDPLIELLPEHVKADGVADLLSVIRDCASQIGLLSKQLLGFRRDGAEVAVETVDGAHLLERSLGMLRPALKDVDVRLDLHFDGVVTCAPALVLQVLGNLLENAAHAAKAAAKDGGRGWVRVSTFAHDDRFVVEVSDSGPGVPVPLRERIFEPFFTTKAPGEGTGLGLSTSRQIAERHHGDLRVATSEESTFRFELPLHSGAKNAIAAVGTL